jgi:hypothetical protein
MGLGLLWEQARELTPISFHHVRTYWEGALTFWCHTGILILTSSLQN